MQQNEDDLEPKPVGLIERAGTTTRGYRFPGQFDIPDVALYAQYLASDVDTDVGLQDARIDKRIEYKGLADQSTHSVPVPITTDVTVLATSAGPAFTVTPGRTGVVFFSIRALVKSPGSGGQTVRLWVQKRKGGGPWENLYTPIPGNSEMNQTGGAWINFSHAAMQLLNPGLLDFRLVGQASGGANWQADNSYIRAFLIGEMQ
jgi:hypothetical protein